MSGGPAGRLGQSASVVQTGTQTVSISGSGLQVQPLAPGGQAETQSCSVSHAAGRGGGGGGAQMPSRHDSGGTPGIAGQSPSAAQVGTQTLGPWGSA